MQDQEIKDLIQDLETVGLAPTTEEMLKALKKDYEEKEKRITELKKNVWDNYTVKKALSLETLEDLLGEVTRLRDQAKIKRSAWRDKFIKEGKEKIEELATILGKETGVYYKGTTRKSKPKDWYTQAISELTEESQRLTGSSFWGNSEEYQDMITKGIGECRKIKAENEAKSKLWQEFQWCKSKLIEMGKINEKIAESLSVTSVIELTHAVLKEQHTIENGLTGEKCYCESHGEDRHYHFSDTFWNGEEVIVYSNSETY